MNDRLKGFVAGAGAALGAAAAQARVAAQETASAGNGGVATASANGGAVAIGDVNSGGNAGNAIGVGDTGQVVCDKWGNCWGAGGGNVAVDGGTVSNATDLGVTANGGTAIADASGGDDNLAFVS